MSDGLFTPYFPRATRSHTLRDPPDLPERPINVGPILDPASTTDPLGVFKQAIHNVNYIERSLNSDADLPPSEPQGLSETYLIPSLAKHERLRLTLLWYYTRDLLQDRDFLQRLQEKLNMVQQIVGWEFAILGILSEDVYSRLVTAGVPLAILPRRESTCSHTINQPSGVSRFVGPRLGQRHYNDTSCLDCLYDP